MIAVAAILGLAAVVAVSRWGGSAISVASAEGYGRRLALAMTLAQRQAIAEGTSAAVVFTRTDGQITSADIVRATSGGDEIVDETLDVPDGVQITALADRWEFDFSGGLTQPIAGGTVSVEAASWTWGVTVNAITGHVRCENTGSP